MKKTIIIIIATLLLSAGLVYADTQTIDITDNGFIDWTTDQGATNIHSGNYTDNDTTYTAGDGLTLTGTDFDVDFANSTETTAGSETLKAITPDGLAGSSIFGRKTVELVPIAFDADTEVADGIFYFHIPASLNGMNLVSVHGLVVTAGTTGTTDWQLYNLTDSQNMLSTKLTIDSGETGSDTAATPAVINTSYDDVATNDVIRLDCDAVSTTKAKGTVISLEFALP